MKSYAVYAKDGKKSVGPVKIFEIS